VCFKRAHIVKEEIVIDFLEPWTFGWWPDHCIDFSIIGYVGVGTTLGLGGFGIYYK